MNINITRLLSSALPLSVLLLTACLEGGGGGGTTATTHPDGSGIVSNSAIATATANAMAQNLAASTAMSYSP